MTLLSWADKFFVEVPPHHTKELHCFRPLDTAGADRRVVADQICHRLTLQHLVEMQSMRPVKGFLIGT